MPKKKVTKATLYLENGVPFKTANYNQFRTIVYFEDETWGIYDHADQNDSHFTPGQEVEYNEKVHNGKTYLKKPKGTSSFTGGSRWVPKTNAEYKKDAVGWAMGHVKDMVIAGTIDLKKYPTTLTAIMNAVHKEIDRIEG